MPPHRLPPLLAEWWMYAEQHEGNAHPRPLFRIRQRHQTGGGTIRIADHPITVLETPDGNTMVAYGGQRDGILPACFRLKLDYARHHASLEDLKTPTGRGRACFDDWHNGGADVVRAAFLWAQCRGMRTLEFTDNSSHHCLRGSEARVRLADFYILLHGKTWYESILSDAGATALTVSQTGTPDALDRARRNAARVSWITMRGDTTPPPIPLPSDVDPAAPGSARAILHFLRGQNRIDVCEYIAPRLPIFLANSNIPTLHGAHWDCEIPPLPADSPACPPARIRTQNTLRNRPLASRRSTHRYTGGATRIRRRS